MFANFKKTFNKEKLQSEQKLPQVLVDYFSEKYLPKGFKYIWNERGGYVAIDGENSLQRMKIEGLSPVLTDSQKTILGDNYSLNDLFDYSYNAQTPIRLKLIKGEHIIINDKKIKLTDWIKSPNGLIEKVDKSSFLLFPPKFPKPFTLELGCTEYKRNYEFRQIPNESVNVMAFEMTRELPFKLKYFVNPSEKRFSFNISFNLELVSSVQELVETGTIFNSFGNGEGYINGERIVVGDAGFEQHKFNTKVLSFWNKVLQIGKKMGKEYDLYRDAIDFNTVCKVELLYQSLINCEPVRDVIKVDYLLSDKDTCVSKEEYNDLIGKQIWYGVEMITNIEAIFIHEQLPVILGINNAIVTNIESTEEGYKLLLGDTSKEEKKYVSALLFKDMNDLNEYKNKNKDRIIGIFKDAKSPKELL